MTLLSLEGKVAFISGSTRGIGWSIARRFAEQKASVVLNGRSNPDLLQARVLTLKQDYGITASAFLGDFADPKQIWNCYQQIIKDYGKIDIVVNNAGIMKPAPLGMISDENIHDSFNLNAIGTLYSMQTAAKLMMRKKSGSIINISSILGISGHAGQVLYSGTKSAVIGMTKSAAKELAPHQIRVNCIAPGFIDTDLTQGISKEIVASIKMGRIGDSMEVANAVLFFASSLSEYVTGQVLGVDGGMIV